MRADKTAVLWRGQDVTDEVVSEANAEKASRVSQILEVRKALLQAQRNCAKTGPGLVAEGRDCGTIVFPNAVFKDLFNRQPGGPRQPPSPRAGPRCRDAFRPRKPSEISRIGRGLQRRSRCHRMGEVLDTNHLSLSETVEQIYEWAKSAMAQSVKSL